MPDCFQSYAQQYIDGAWCQGTGDWDVIDFNPYTGDKLAAITVATAAEVDAAYRAAERAQSAWADTAPERRRLVFEQAGRLLERQRDEIAAAMTAELGAPLARARYEIDQCAELLQDVERLPYRTQGQVLTSTVAGRENHVSREAVGTVCVIAPCRFPLLSALKPVAAALALGNAVVLKPHSAAPLCGGTLPVRLLEEAGLPGGLLNLVITDIAEIGDALIEHPVPRTVSFAGSAAVGRHVSEIAGRHLKRAVVETGGNGALLVLADADVDQAVEAAVFSCFLDQGQPSMAASRVLVDRAIAGEFTEKFTGRVAALRTGDPAHPDTRIGPMMSPRVVEELTRDIRRAVEGGAELLVGGETRGNLVPPTVLRGVSCDDPLLEHEVLGPVALLTETDGDEQAIALANAHHGALAAAVHTRDVRHGLRVARRLTTAIVHVNDSTLAKEPTAPPGGEGESGVRRLNGEAVVDAFTRTKWVSLQQGRGAFFLS